MPLHTINARGDCLHGVGGGYLNLNNRPLISGQAMGFADDETAGFASGADLLAGRDWTASAMDLRTGQTRRLNPATPTGANEGYAGGGEFAWWWGSDQPGYGMNATYPLHGGDQAASIYNLPWGGLLGMGPDASIAYKNRSSYGPCWVREVGGETWELTPGDAFEVCLVGERRALWREYGQSGVFVVGLPVPRILPGSDPMMPSAFWFRDEWWLSYFHSTAGVIAHSFADPTRGFRLVAPGRDAWPVSRTLADGRLCCWWSATIAAQAGHLTQVLREPTDPLEDLSEPLPDPDLDPYGKPIAHWAYFTLDGDRGYGDHYDAVLHACWCATVSDVEKANARDLPVIASTSLITRARRPVLIICANDYSGAPPLETQLDDATPLARELGIGLVVMDEHEWVTLPANLPIGAIAAFKAYRNPHESLDEYEARIQPIADRITAAGFATCAILGCDDRLQTLSEAELVATIRRACLVFAPPSRMVAAFSYGRAGTLHGAPTGGGIVHPTAWRWIEASSAASDPIDWHAYRLDPPEKESDMSAIASRLKEAFKPVKEIPISGSTDVALELPDLVNGKKKIKCTSPEGQDQVRPEDDRNWEPRDIGPWERYQKTPTAYVADRSHEGGQVWVYPRA
jgi:hypothetical protein